MESGDKTREILGKVRQIEIRTHRMVTDALSGAYHSVFKGQGMDFEEVREYAPGDDVRSIDWNVTAKMDRPFVKKFREERELTIMLMVDLSASGNFGSTHESKRELAAEVASVLAFSATRNNDKVGLLLFSDRVEAYIPPRKGRQHILRIIREVLFFRPAGRGTGLTLALNTVRRLLKRKAIVFLLSDFLQDDDSTLPLTGEVGSNDLYRALAIARRRHDLTAMILTDPREQELPDVGSLILEDAETGQLVEIHTGRENVRSLYRELNEKRVAQAQKNLRKAGLDTLVLTTGQPYIHQLRRFFENRARRR